MFVQLSEPLNAAWVENQDRKKTLTLESRRHLLCTNFLSPHYIKKPFSSHLSQS